jgi:hypothetical protein
VNYDALVFFVFQPFKAGTHVTLPIVKNVAGRALHEFGKADFDKRLRLKWGGRLQVQPSACKANCALSV